MRVLVVDDSAFMRRAMTQMLTSDPAVEVVAAARNGKEGVELAKKHQPDVITLDIEMPEMDGLTALRHIMRDCPTQVLMVSSLTTAGSHASLTALKLGAADVLAKDMSQISLSVTNIRDELLRLVKALGAAPRLHRAKHAAHAPDSPQAVAAAPTYRPGAFDAVCIGSSTGGPPVLETLIAAIPESIKTPVVIAQHMPELFTRSMAERFDEVSPLKVVHAADGMPLQNGHIYIAPGGRNIHLEKVSLAQNRIRVNDEPKDAIYRPSVDALFASAAVAVGKRTLAIVLTGIGEDGLIGARDLHAKGAVILAQSAESCVVYGMPKAVTQAALIQASLNPTQLAATLASLGHSPVTAKA
jgi:two-component system chemotaxis response regulator CheB